MPAEAAGATGEAAHAHRGNRQGRTPALLVVRRTRVHSSPNHPGDDRARHPCQRQQAHASLRPLWRVQRHRSRRRARLIYRDPTPGGDEVGSGADLPGAPARRWSAPATPPESRRPWLSCPLPRRRGCAHLLATDTVLPTGFLTGRHEWANARQTFRYGIPFVSLHVAPELIGSPYCVPVLPRDRPIRSPDGRREWKSGRVHR